MPLTTTARKATVAVEDLAQAFAGLAATQPGGGAGLSAEALADQIRRNQAPELVSAIKKATGR
jgi:hypothetical protein